MPETGGPATQAGIFYQNSVAALALAELLDLDPRIARERAIEVRLEAPEDVDDIVVRFADDHRSFQNVKLGLRVGGGAAWSGIWRSLSAQYGSGTFGSHDRLVLVVEERSRDSEAVVALCERAASSVDQRELRDRLACRQLAALDSIANILGSSTTTYELLRRVSVRHLPLAEIERELGRRRLAGGQSPPPTLLPILRDVAGGQARRRGLFQPAPLRRLLRQEHGLLLGEPPEWGLESYRATVKRLSRIEVPGMGVAGPAHELFVWPRTREHDRTRPTGFEDEDPSFVDRDERGLDLQAFPSERLDRVVVAAGPGYGKSALLTYVAGRLAEGPMVPVSLPLASLASADCSIVSFLSTSISQELDLSADWRQLAEQGLLVLLLDGLDEVPSSRRPTLMQRIATFSARYPRAPWMLTVRDPAVVTGLPEATVVELLPLNDDDIQRFAEAMKSYLGEVEAWTIVRRLKLYPDLDRLARIPLFLVMLLAASDLTTHEPVTRSDLIESYLKTLFSPAHHKPVDNPTDRSATLRAIAETLAFERLERQEIGATEREVREVIGRVSDSSAGADVLLEQLKANGILKAQTAIRLQFPYPIVQEYLAACHLINCYSNSLEQRIEGAMQRPWAQAIQFGLELHPDPEPIIRAMLARPDDAFCTGLRLVGRCIANGATVSTALRDEVGSRLVEYWVYAPSRSRERVGRLLADGYADPPSDALTAALHHRWLVEDGAGDIISKLNSVELTIGVVDSLIAEKRSSILIYQSLKPALRSAGDAALRAVIDSMDPNTLDDDEIISISSFFSNFSSGSVSRELVLSVARDRRLPAQARMRAYELAAAPLEEDGIALAVKGFRHDDWDRHYEADDLVKIHADPPNFLGQLLRDTSIPIKRRKDLAADVTKILPDERTRRAFSQACISNSSLEEEIRLALQLIEARFGDHAAFVGLVDAIGQIPVEFAAHTITLFGHYRDRALAEHAATLTRNRELSAEEVAKIANSVSTGMLYVFEMDYGFGGGVRPVPPHPGIAEWTELLEEWSAREDLSPLGRLTLMTVATELGSEWARAKLEAEIFAIDDMDGPEWTEDDEGGYTLSRALREVRRRKPFLSKALIEKAVASARYNVATTGIEALQSLGDGDALKRLIDLHKVKSDWFLKDAIANTIELMAARQGVGITKVDGGYQFAS